jgi:Holliday junction resolvase RusA-like endonuclease
VSDVADLRREITFVVFGIPTPKGSKRAFVVKGRPIVTESAGEKLKDWSRRVSEVVQSVAGSQPMLDGAIKADVAFTLPRPKSGRKADVWHAKRPDLDKLQRALFDECSGALFADDAQIAEIHAMKIYADGEMRTGVEVRLEQLT